MYTFLSLSIYIYVNTTNYQCAEAFVVWVARSLDLDLVNIENRSFRDGMGAPNLVVSISCIIMCMFIISMISIVISSIIISSSVYIYIYIHPIYQNNMILT